MKSKAIQIYQQKDPEHSFRIISVEVPDPSPAEMQVAVEFSGINFAEILARRGLYPEAPRLPYIPGYEVMGTVTKTGSEVTSFSVGDRVVSGIRFGGYSSCVNIRSHHAYKIPGDLDPGIALALVTQGSTAWIASNEVIQIYPEDMVLVQAAGGGVGSMLVQLAKLKGATVIGTTSSDKKLEYLSSIGVDYPVNYHTNDYFRQISKILGPDRRLDVAFDSIGGMHFRRISRLLGAGGRMVAFGYATALHSRSRLGLLKMLFDYGRVNPTSLIGKSQSICGINVLKILDYKPSLLVHAYRNMLDLTLSGNITPKVHGTFNPEEIHKAHQILESRSAQGKMIIRW